MPGKLFHCQQVEKLVISSDATRQSDNIIRFVEHRLFARPEVFNSLHFIESRVLNSSIDHILRNYANQPTTGIFVRIGDNFH